MERTQDANHSQIAIFRMSLARPARARTFGIVWCGRVVCVCPTLYSRCSLVHVGNDVGARMGETRAMQGSMLASDGYED